MAPLQFRKLSPVLIVDAIEPCLPFWTERLGFVILAKDGVEVMYQSRDSVRSDVPALADAPAGSSLYIEVSDIEAVERAVQGVEIVVPRRQTFYGADEIGVREPGGNVVMFAQPS